MSISVRGGACVNKGFSLVELMIALVIGLIIVLGAGQLVVLGVQSFREMDELARRQEAIRYMADILSEDMRSAFNRNSQNESVIAADQQAVQVSADGKGLTLEYFAEIEIAGVKTTIGRKGLPYCDVSASPPEQLHWLRYEFSEGDLKVSHVCHVEGSEAASDHSIDNLDGVASEVVVSDLVDVTFSDAGDGVISSFDVAATFPPIGEEVSSKTFTFLVTNRIKAMAAINPSSSDF
ncbi:PilW family protein [Halomonas ventosae]|uniref:Prepilin-type N-terminal cleavage/methylation domain-containing protein n=1 Tax=Halomonas ventosae TaxID=229007 RepID=A0A2T0VF15_9GAMM|nr:prepilin-type N-terminal cleavage/methylation domain-containing protein [Halomonas ventosae]PRY68778.1 prepilin-type N-terminal cleavage/methylation domain-containing protein [Halomonas ventosae]